MWEYSSQIVGATWPKPDKIIDSAFQMTGEIKKQDATV
jgi:hypothetical protein